MLEIKEVAQFLTDEINKISEEQEDKYEFKIFAELGKSENGKVCGILKSEEPIITPIKEIINARYKMTVEFAVSAPTSNFNLINIEKIFNLFIKKYNETEQPFENGKGLMTFSLSHAKEYHMEHGQGEFVPIVFSVFINYTENVVTSHAKVWQIRPKDDNTAEFLTIPYLSEQVMLEKNGKTSCISDALFQQTLLTSQLKYYKFIIPYETNDNLCSMLQRDILTGDFNKKYILRYYDGVSFTQESPYLSVVSIFRTGDSSSRKPESSTFNITFSDVDDGNNKLKYYMALIDNPFDSQTENIRFFESQDEQLSYYNEKIAAGANYDEIQAPNLNSLFLTNQIYLNTRKYDIFDLISKNYAIIKATNGTSTHYFYYRVTNGDIGANGQVVYNLKLDSIQTYLFNPKLKIQGSFIQKAHLDRWIDNNDGTVSFDGNANSALFEREEIKEAAKLLVNRQPLKMLVDDAHKELQEAVTWIDENIIAWAYIIVDVEPRNFNGETITLSPTFITKRIGTAFYKENLYSTSTLVYPIFKQDKKIILQNESYSDDNNMSWGVESLYNFAEENNGFSFIKNIKLSIKPPINFNNLIFSLKYSINSENNLVFYFKDTSYSAQNTVGSTQIYLRNNYDRNTSYKFYRQQLSGLEVKSISAIMDYNEDYQEPLLFKTEINLPKVNFFKNEIINKDRNLKFNPKLNNSDYRTMRICFAGDIYEIDIQKINQSSLNFEYIEMITPDITKGILRIKTDSNDNIFNKYYAESFNGLLFSTDLSIPISNDQLNSFLANNKNAYLSFQNQQQYTIDSATANMATSAVNSVSNTISQFAKGNFAGGITSAISTVSDTVNQAIQLDLKTSYNQTQFDLTIDNMRNAPQTLVNANGNAIFLIATAGLRFYVEIYEGLTAEMQMANDIMFRDGYTFNRFGEIFDYINTRKHFNYIKAILGNISGVPISEEARIDLRQRFASGIRFWKSDEIDYTKENYELKLEN